MSNLIAKPIVKNKFWIVERDNGAKVATIQAAVDGVVFVDNSRREKFASVKSLSAKHNIKFDRTTSKSNRSKIADIYGYPVTGSVFNPLYDVKRRLPIFTKTAKSRSYYCAGHYLVAINGQWTHAFCPKLITLNRYRYLGPFVSKKDASDRKAIL